MTSKIAVVGIGRLGLSYSLVLEQNGYDVLGVDKEESYIQKINERSFLSLEPGVSRALEASKNFRATANLNEAVDFSDLIFVLVATPSLPDGSYDHSQLRQVVDRFCLLGRQKRSKHLVVSCTTMPGYCDQLARELEPFNWKLSYNPEFIAQGSILRDLEHPDIVLIGQEDDAAAVELTGIYHRSCKNVPCVQRMDRLSAEITKLSLNCFLTMKIAFANMIGDLASDAGAQPERILQAIGADSRVGTKYLGYGFGYGGPCLPRDNRALQFFAATTGTELPISAAVDKANALHLEHQVQTFRKKQNTSEPVVLGPVTYKRGSLSLENSQQFEYAKRLARLGYQVTIRDQKEVLNQLEKETPSLFYSLEELGAPKDL